MRKASPKKVKGQHNYVMCQNCLEQKQRQTVLKKTNKLCTLQKVSLEISKEREMMF